MSTIRYKYGANLIINPGAEQGLNGWDFAGNVQSVSGGVNGNKCFKLPAHSSIKQNVILPQECDSIILRAYFYVDKVDDVDSLNIEFKIVYVSTELDFVMLHCEDTPFTKTKVGFLNGIQVIWGETEAYIDVNQELIQYIEVSVEVGDYNGNLYLDDLQLRPNIPVLMSTTDMIRELVDYRTLAITSMIVEVDFIHLYATKPTVLITVHGGVTNVDIEFIIKYDENKDSFFYTGADINFPPEQVGLIFGMLVIGR